MTQASCGSKSSSSGGPDGGPIPTSDMALNAFVHATDETQAIVVASFDDGNLFGTAFALTGGDVVQACVLTYCARLEHDTSIVVDAVVPTGHKGVLPYAVGPEYVVSFSRPTGVSAPRSSVTLPPPFVISAPRANEQLGDGDSFSVTWFPAGAGEVVTAEVDTTCEHEDGLVSDLGSKREVDDGDGTVEFSVDRLVADMELLRRSPTPVTRCEMVVQVTHQREGIVDPAFGGGYILGRVSRSVTLTYVPPAQQ